MPDPHDAIVRVVRKARVSPVIPASIPKAAEDWPGIRVSNERMSAPTSNARASSARRSSPGVSRMSARLMEIATKIRPARAAVAPLAAMKNGSHSGVLVRPSLRTGVRRDEQRAEEPRYASSTPAHGIVPSLRER